MTFTRCARPFPPCRNKCTAALLIYLDNAATAQMPRCVAEAVQALELRRGNVHRGIHALSEECTAAYESARAAVADFLRAGAEQIQFTSGTTDAVNRVADALRGH